MNLTEAFQKLDLLESEDFNVSSSMDSAALQNFLNDDELVDKVDIIDVDAETEDDLEDSYVGKIVTECVICHSKFYKNPEDIIIDQETGNCNLEDECPICFSQDGYKIVGKIVPYDGDEEITDKEEETEVTIDDADNDGDIEVDNVEVKDEAEDEDSEMTESLHECDDNLDETFGGTLAGAAIGAMTGHPIKGALAGSGVSNILKGEGNNVANYAKIGAALGGVKGAAIGAGVGSVAGDAIQDVASNVSNNILKPAMKMPSDRNRMKLQGESLEEDIESATVETEDTIMSMDSDEDGKVTITSEPKTEETEVKSDEVVAPIDVEDAEVIADAQPEEETEDEVTEEEVEEEPADDEEASEEDFDVEDFDEESFDDLGESYLRKVYENVNSYKTTNVASKGNNLIVEGVINFNSGKAKKTTFVFESYKATKSGRVKFIGENKQITRGRKAFTITGNINGKKFISESLNYNYRQKDATGKSTRLYGTVKK